jgi:hypothetical protein
MHMSCTRTLSTCVSVCLCVCESKYVYYVRGGQCSRRWGLARIVIHVMYWVVCSHFVYLMRRIHTHWHRRARYTCTDTYSDPCLVEPPLVRKRKWRNYAHMCHMPHIHQYRDSCLVEPPLVRIGRWRD